MVHFLASFTVDVTGVGGGVGGEVSTLPNSLCHQLFAGYGCRLSACLSDSFLSASQTLVM